MAIVTHHLSSNTEVYIRKAGPLSVSVNPPPFSAHSTRAAVVRCVPLCSYISVAPLLSRRCSKVCSSEAVVSAYIHAVIHPPRCSSRVVVAVYLLSEPRYHPYKVLKLSRCRVAGQLYIAKGPYVKHDRELGLIEEAGP